MRDKTNRYAAKTWAQYFLSLLFTSVFVIAILIVAHEVTTLKIITTMNKEFSEYSETTARQVREILEACAYQNFYNPQVTGLRVQAEINNFDEMLAMRVLNSFVSTNAFIDSVYVYNRKKNYIYSTAENGSNFCAAFPDRQAVALLTGAVSSAPYLINRDAVYSFIVSDSNRMGYYDNAMMINLNADTFNKLYCVDTNNECLLYRAENDTIEFSNDASVRTSDFADVFKKINAERNLAGYVVSAYGRRKNIFIYFYFADPQLYYIRAISYGSLHRDMRYFRTFTFFVLLTTISGWAVVSLLVRKRFYLPLHKIVNGFSAQRDSQNTIVDLNQWIEHEIEYRREYDETVKSEFLKHLLTSSADVTAPIENSFKEYHIAFAPDKAFYLILSESMTLPVGLSSVPIERVSFNNMNVFFVQPENAQWFKMFRMRAGKQGAEVWCCSEKLTSWNDTHKSIEHLYELYSFRIFYPEKQFFFERELLVHKNELWYPDDLETMLLKSIKSSDEKNADHLYRTIVQSLLCYRYSTLIFGLKRLYFVLSSSYRRFSDDADTKLDNSNEYISEVIDNAACLDSLNVAFYDIIQRLCKANQCLRDNKHQQIATNIKSFVEKNYVNNQLSLTMIADELDFSETYLAKIFKSLEHCSVADYINKTRMREAAVLLKTQNLTIKEIANKIGIANSQYFYILFKKFSGDSPAQFRKKYGSVM